MGFAQDTYVIKECSSLLRTETRATSSRKQGGYLRLTTRTQLLEWKLYGPVARSLAGGDHRETSLALATLELLQLRRAVRTPRPKCTLGPAHGGSFAVSSANSQSPSTRRSKLASWFGVQNLTLPISCRESSGPSASASGVEVGNGEQLAGRARGCVAQLARRAARSDKASVQQLGRQPRSISVI